MFNNRNWINADTFDWYELSKNPNAIHLLIQCPEKIDWFSLNDIDVIDTYIIDLDCLLKNISPNKSHHVQLESNEKQLTSEKTTFCDTMLNFNSKNIIEAYSETLTDELIFSVFEKDIKRLTDIMIDTYIDNIHLFNNNFDIIEQYNNPNNLTVAYDDHNTIFTDSSFI